MRLTNMKLTKTQKDRIIHHARELFKINLEWAEKESIGKVGVSPSGKLQHKNIFAIGVEAIERPIQYKMEKYIEDVLNIEYAICIFMVLKNHDGDGGLDISIEVDDWETYPRKTVFKHREKVIEFKDRIVHKVLA